MAAFISDKSIVPKWLLLFKIIVVIYTNKALVSPYQQYVWMILF